jgi:hypothetical protein
VEPDSYKAVTNELLPIGWEPKSEQKRRESEHRAKETLRFRGEEKANRCPGFLRTLFVFNTFFDSAWAEKIGPVVFALYSPKRYANKSTYTESHLCPRNLKNRAKK